MFRDSNLRSIGRTFEKRGRAKSMGDFGHATTMQARKMNSLQNQGNGCPDFLLPSAHIVLRCSSYASGHASTSFIICMRCAKTKVYTHVTRKGCGNMSVHYYSYLWSKVFDNLTNCTRKYVSFNCIMCILLSDSLRVKLIIFWTKLDDINECVVRLTRAAY